MLKEKIPVNLVTGFLGAGKTTVIRHLLSTRPAGERWAVLVNEFGEIGIDGHILPTKEGLIKEVAGGCMCCINGVPMRVSLNALLAKKPDRLIIETSGLGHPDEVLAILRGDYYRELVALQATLTLVDPRVVTQARYVTHPVFKTQLAVADVLVATRGDLCAPAEAASFEAWIEQSPDLVIRRPPVVWITNGCLDAKWLMTATQSGAQKTRDSMSKMHSLLLMPHLSQMPNMPATLASGQSWCRAQNNEQGAFAVGWLFSDDIFFERGAVMQWFAMLNCERAKGIFKSVNGGFVVNAERGELSSFDVSEVVNSRVQLIALTPIDVQKEESALLAIMGNS